MKIGIIGTGKHGSRYARHILRDIDGLELAAVCRRSNEGHVQAQEWGVRYYKNWQDLIEDSQVDAVIAVTPPVLNLDIARHCAAAGKPLLLEKPLSVDVVAGEEIVALFDKASLPLTIGQTLRYNTVIQGLRDNFYRVGRFLGFSASHRLEPSTLGWLEDPAVAGGGVILHTAVHMFDALRFITGHEVVRVRASSFHIHNPGVEDLFTAQLEMENNVAGTVDACKIGKARTGRYEFIGINGELHADQIHGRMDYLSGAALQPLDHNPLSGTIIPLLVDWYAFLRGEADNPISGEEGLTALRVCAACQQSAGSGNWVDVERG